MLTLGTVMVSSEEPDRLADFYTKVLGEAGWQSEGYTGWKCGQAYFLIGPHTDVKGSNEMPGRIIFNFETDDVPGEFARIKGLGAAVQQEPYQPSAAGGEVWLATLADPDGNFFQLASPVPDEMMG